MPQLSLYLTENEMNDLKRRAGKKNQSLSAYTRDALYSCETIKPTVAQWWEVVSGSIQDDTFEAPEDSLDDVREISALELA